MHVRVRLCGKPEVIVSVESKLTKIDRFRLHLHEKFGVKPNLQRLLYGGKLLENGYTFHDYNIKLNDVIQLIVRDPIGPEKNTSESENVEIDEEETKIEYKDAVSKFYAVGDLVDMRDIEHGAWFEGRINRIVRNPSTTDPVINSDCPNKENEDPPSEENDLEIKQTPVNRDKTNTGIEKYLIKINQKSKMNGIIKTEDHLLFQVHMRSDEDSFVCCKLEDIRPRARNKISAKDLQVGQRVMLNHNLKIKQEVGYWYDFEMKDKLRIGRNNDDSNYDLIGTIYIGSNPIPETTVRMRICSCVYLIEEVIPLKDRTVEYNMLMTTETLKRPLPPKCRECIDDINMPCRECGCCVCAGKNLPESILLCDECDLGYHMDCLKPPLLKVPVGDWYCTLCKRDNKLVVAPGAAKQKKQETKTDRDWGRGMACVGKTKTCSMPSNHFGPIPGIDVGMCWRFRMQLCETGVHRPPVSGIHGRDKEGAYSIVLSGGYEDDVDHGNEFTYTGSGGRDLSGNKRTAGQSCDQTLTRENRGLARNCAVKQVNEKGDDAGENWRQGRPVRVMRSYKTSRYFPKYAPKEGIRYDGIYKVVKYYPEKGKSGFRVWKYLLRRDDPQPAPWETNAKHFDVIYPDGYLEAEAEKNALKKKNAKPKGTRKSTKRVRQGSNCSASEETEQVTKKARLQESKNKAASKSPQTSSIVGSSESDSAMSEDCETSLLTEEEKGTIALDTLNAKLWEECYEICKKKGKKEFIEHLNSVFLCIICQQVAANPVTTSCLHNFCMNCLKQAFKAAGSKVCPCCRNNMSQEDIGPNDQLKAALRAVMNGYDANRT